MNDSPTFLELIQLVREGDEQAAGELVRQYEPELRRFVRYRLSDRSLRKLLDSIDVTQSVFAKFFFQLEQGRFDLDNPRQLINLLTTMASNRLCDHYRNTQRLKRNPVEAAGQRCPEESVPDGAPDPVDAIMSRELVDVFRARLDQAEQELLDRRMDGCGWKEIADLQGESPEALRKRLTRAIDRAATELGWSRP
jgi:RNA polymerase sigma-70 factor (ECF subfamily)